MEQVYTCSDLLRWTFFSAFLRTVKRQQVGEEVVQSTYHNSGTLNLYGNTFSGNSAATGNRNDIYNFATLSSVTIYELARNPTRTIPLKEDPELR